MKTKNLLHNKIIIGSFLVAILCSAGVCFISNSASALTYQSSTDVSFTFDPTITINVSDDLLISSLSPGSSADSNIITVSTSTNNPTGYVLSASVGSSTNATTNLVNGSYNFSSIATDASLASLTTNNTWGYSISDDDGSTWDNYSGLPLYTSANWKEIASTNTSGTNDFKFKIGAKASSTQASGDYTNVINFTAVANMSSERNYTVNYIDTSGTAENMPAQQTGTTSNNEISLSSDYPYSEGEFYVERWCTTYDGYTEYPETCDGEEYFPGDIITVADGAGDIIINLYTVWAQETFGEYSVDIDNQSDATIGGDFSIGPNNWDSYSCSVDCPLSLNIEIISPSSCPSNWNWEAEVYPLDAEYPDVYSGIGDGSFELYMPDVYTVTVTGSCDGGGN